MKKCNSRPNRTSNLNDWDSWRSWEDVEVRSAADIFSLESAYGSVKPRRQPVDFEGVTQAAKDAKAERTYKSLNKGG